MTSKRGGGGGGANYKNVMHDDVILVDVADVGDQNIEC